MANRIMGITVEIGGDTTKLQTALKGVNGQIKSTAAEQELKKLETQANQSATAMQKIAATGEKLKTTGENISNAGQKLLPVTVAVTGMGAASLKTAAGFESSMSQVQATMGITKDSMSTVDGQSVNTMDKLSKLAKKMGSETALGLREMT